jgi:hypothetical protein
MGQLINRPTVEYADGYYRYKDVTKIVTPASCTQGNNKLGRLIKPNASV